MAENDARVAVAEGARGLDVFHFLHAHDLAAHDARHGEPLDRADGGEEAHDFANALEIAQQGELAQPGVEGVHGLLQEDHDEDDKDRERQGVEDVHHAHEEGVGAAADIAGNRAVGDPDEERDHRGDEADHERDSAAVEQAREEVASELVGAQPVFCGRGSGAAREILVGVAVVEEGRHGDAGEGEHEHEDARDHGQAVAPEAQPRVAPRRVRALGGGGGDGGGRRGAHSNFRRGLSQTCTTSTIRLRAMMSTA